MERAVVNRRRRWWLHLAPSTTAPRTAREFVARACAVWCGEKYSELGQLVISELVTNAVRHTGTPIEIEVQLESDRLWLSVHDEGEGVPAVVPREQRAIGGVGLDLVSQVAQSWGVTPDPHGGKDVWCVLSAQDPMDCVNGSKR